MARKNGFCLLWGSSEQTIGPKDCSAAQLLVQTRTEISRKFQETTIDHYLEYLYSIYMVMEEMQQFGTGSSVSRLYGSVSVGFLLSEAYDTRSFNNSRDALGTSRVLAFDKAPKARILSNSIPLNDGWPMNDACNSCDPIAVAVFRSQLYNCEPCELCFCSPTADYYL